MTQWKLGNELAPYHPAASHVSPDYRDGWNACYRAWAAIAPEDARDAARLRWCIANSAWPVATVSGDFEGWTVFYFKTGLRPGFPIYADPTDAIDAAIAAEGK